MAVVLLGAVLIGAYFSRPERSGFSAIYVGARLVLQGQGRELYDLGEQAQLRARLFPGPDVLVYEHPAFEALLLAPLARLPYRTAYLAWAAFNALLWVALAWLLRPYLPAPREPLAYLALWLLFVPLWSALFQGQTSIALLAVYAATFVALQRGRDLRAGLLLGLGLFKFELVLPLALIFLLRRKWKFLAGFSASGALLAALSLLVSGWRGMASYPRLLAEIARHPESAALGSAAGMASLQGLAHGLLGQRLSGGVVVALVAAGSALLIGFTAARWRRVDAGKAVGSSDLMFAAALSVCLMTGFHVCVHDVSLLVLALFLAVKTGASDWGLGAGEGRSFRTGAWRVALTAVVVVLWLPPLYLWLLATGRVYFLFPLLLAFALAAEGAPKDGPRRSPLEG